MKKFAKILVASLVLVSEIAPGGEAQVVLRADKSRYLLGEAINLSYETLWLGSNDGQMRFSSIAFPEIEVLFLNRYPVRLTETAVARQLLAPSRHERATFAPTMRRVSKEFTINDPNSPTMFLNGKCGYFDLDRRGAYIIRAVFRANTMWELYEGQELDIYSTAIAIGIGQSLI